MLVQRVLMLLWKYLLVKEEELFYAWKVSKFLLAALFGNARRVDVSKFRFENMAILTLRPRKPIFLLFSKMKGFLPEQLPSRLLMYLKAIYGQKMKEIDFWTLVTRWSIFPDRVALKIESTTNHGHVRNIFTRVEKYNNWFHLPLDSSE